MTLPVCFACALLSVGLTPKPLVPKSATAQGSKLEQSQRLYAQGEFEVALKLLDAAAAEGGSEELLSQVHLLRSRCHAARQDFARAEEALAQALDADPEASLDPQRVDPTLVKMLEGVRARLGATVTLSSTPPGATVIVDGKEVLSPPNTLKLPAGRHRLQARWGEGPVNATEIVVKPKRDVVLSWVQAEAAPPSPRVPPCDAPPPPPKPVFNPFAEARGAVEAPVNVGSFVTGGLELGGGLEVGRVGFGLWAKLFPNFGLTPRFGLSIPLTRRISALIELGVPVQFLPQNGMGVGVWGQGGVEFRAWPWLGAWAMVGGRHHLLWPFRNDPTALTATVGFRLRVPEPS